MISHCLVIFQSEQKTTLALTQNSQIASLYNGTHAHSKTIKFAQCIIYKLTVSYAKTSELELVDLQYVTLTLKWKLTLKLDYSNQIAIEQVVAFDVSRPTVVYKETTIQCTTALVTVAWCGKHRMH